jgi:ComF family protein
VPTAEAVFRGLAALIAPPRCATCGRPCALREVLCPECRRRLSRARPLRAEGARGLDALWSAAPYRGVVRDLVSALKFRRLLPVAELMAGEIASRAPAGMWSGALVPVPPAPARFRERGFDPAEALTIALSRILGLPVSRSLAREDGPRQVGRPRPERLAEPPAVRAIGPIGPIGPIGSEAVLVDDVCTTGATLRRCAEALREVGATRVAGATFARTP